MNIYRHFLAFADKLALSSSTLLYNNGIISYVGQV